MITKTWLFMQMKSSSFTKTNLYMSVSPLFLLVHGVSPGIHADSVEKAFLQDN